MNTHNFICLIHLGQYLCAVCVQTNDDLKIADKVHSN